MGAIAQRGGGAPRALTESESAAYRAARVRALDRAPYLAAGLFGLLPYAWDDTGSFASDARGRVLVDFEALAAVDVGAQAGIVVHEALHVLRRHVTRGRQAAPGHPLAWNVAADLEINDDVLGLGLALPDGALYPAGFGLPEGRTAEWYLGRIETEPVMLAELLEAAESGFCDCSGIGGEPARHAGSGARFAGDGLDGVEIDVMINRIAEAMRSHQKSRGNLPGGMVRWLAEIEAPPVVDWRTTLRSAIRSSLVAAQRGRTDYSRKRVSRRADNTDIMPGMVQYLPRVAFAVDTSGSMGEAELRAGLTELGTLCRQVGLGGDRVAFFTVDAAASEPVLVRSIVDLDLTGGGGTDMRVAYRVAADLRPRPDVFVLVTDGLTPWPDTAPRGMRCIVLVTEERAEVPAWAQRIVIEPPSHHR